MFKRLNLGPIKKRLDEVNREALQFIEDELGITPEEQKLQDNREEILGKKEKVIAQRDAISAEIQKTKADEKDWEVVWKEQALEAAIKGEDLSPDESAEQAGLGKERPMALDGIKRKLKDLGMGLDAKNKVISGHSREIKGIDKQLKEWETARRRASYHAFWDLILMADNSAIPAHRQLVLDDAAHKQLVRENGNKETWAQDFAKLDGMDQFCFEFRGNMLGEIASRSIDEFRNKLYNYNHPLNVYFRDRHTRGLSVGA